MWERGKVLLLLTLLATTLRVMYGIKSICGMQRNIYRHKGWKFKPYKVRGLFLSPIVVLEMVGSVVTEGFYTCSQAETQPCAVSH